MIRIELIHPLLVHYPIALLSIGVILRLIAYWQGAFLLPASRLILLLGAIFAWAAVIAGDFAADIVGPTLSDDSVLEQHELFAYLTASGFTIALFLDGASAFLPRWGGTFSLLAAVLYLLSLASLVMTGYLGGTLVYEQGAAVANLKTHP